MSRDEDCYISQSQARSEENVLWFLPKLFAFSFQIVCLVTGTSCSYLIQIPVTAPSPRILNYSITQNRSKQIQNQLILWLISNDHTHTKKSYSTHNHNTEVFNIFEYDIFEYQYINWLTMIGIFLINLIEKKRIQNRLILCLVSNGHTHKSIGLFPPQGNWFTMTLIF